MAANREVLLLGREPFTAAAARWKTRQQRLPSEPIQENKSMASVVDSAVEPFIERRSYDPFEPPLTRERRQFSNSYQELSPEARELGTAIDQYKLHHRRRFITFEEMLAVVKALGYHK
jgi:hypothetical protein